MELETFNLSNCTSEASIGKAFVRVNSRSGLFSFSKGLSVKIGLDTSKRVAFHRDKHKISDWYLSVYASNEEGFPVKNKSKRNNQVGIKSIVLATKLFEQFGIKESGFTFPVSVEPVELKGIVCYPIITLAAKK